MNKILLVIKREYLTRVRKRSFIVMTILGPILMASLFILPVVLATMSDGTKKTIIVLDETGIFYGKFKNEDNLEFQHSHIDLEAAKDELKIAQDYALLYIPKTELSVPTSAVVKSSVSSRSRLVAPLTMPVAVATFAAVSPPTSATEVAP